MHPVGNMLYLFQTLRVPALVVLGFWFVLQLLNLSTESSGAGDDVAWYAHIVGFLAGYILMRRRKRRRMREFEAL